MTGQHDGYSKFLRPVFHERIISFDLDAIEIFDQVRGSINKSQSILFVVLSQNENLVGSQRR